MSRLGDRDVTDAHRRAMEAKQKIFEAQDAMARVRMPAPATGRRGSGGLRAKKALCKKVDRALAKLRTDLEALDRLVLAAKYDDRVLCTCDAFTCEDVGKIGYVALHNADCPLFEGPAIFSCGCSCMKVGLGKCDLFDEKGRDRLAAASTLELVKETD